MSNVLEYILRLKDQISPALQKLGINSANAKGQVDGIGNQAKNLDNQLKRTASGGISIFNIALGNMVATAATSMARIVPMLGNSIFEGTVKREQDIIGLTTFLGDNAKRVYDAIQHDAAVTPFSTDSLLNVNRALISSGLSAESARKDALNLANAIAAVGKGDAELSNMAANMQQIKTVGKASSMDIKQFAFAGINIYAALSKATGKSVAEVQKMDVTYDLLSQALDKAAQKGGIYAGALEKQGKTLGAMMESAKDQASIFFADFGDMLRPLFEKGLVYFQKFVAYIPKVFAALKPVIMGIGNVFFWLIDVVGSVVKGVQWFYQKVKEGNPAIWIIISTLGVLTAALILTKTWMALSTLWAQRMVIWDLAVAAAKVIWKDAQLALNASMLANPVFLIITGVIALIALIGFLVYKIDGWGNAWKHTVTGMKLIGDWFLTSFKYAFDTMVNGLMIGINKIKAGWYEFKNAVGLGDSAANDHMLAQINADTNARKKAIVDGAKNLNNLQKQALGEFAQAGQSLTWNKKTLGDFKNGVQSKLGITPGKIPGGQTVNSSMGALSDGKGNADKANNAVATGGQRNVTVNMSIGKMIDGFKIVVSNTEEGIRDLEQKVISAVTRGVAAGASLGG